MKNSITNRAIALILSLLLITPLAHSQLSNWANFTSPLWINHIKLSGNTLWITTMGGGIVQYDKTTGQTTILTRTDGLADNQTVGLACRGNQVWIGGERYGIDLYQNGNFTNFNTDNSALRSNQLNSDILVDRNNDIWIAGLLAVYRYDGNTFHRYSLSAWDIRSNGMTQSLAEDTDGTIWFGGFNFSKITTDGKIVEIEKHIINGTNMLNDIAITTDGTKWIAANNGLYKYDGTAVTPTDIQRVGIYALDIDRNARLWLGDSNADLVKYTEGSIQRFHVPTDIENDFITDILCDEDIIWVGMRRSGLWKYENGNFENIPFTENQYPFDNPDGDIVVAPDGNALFPTDDGVIQSDTVGQCTVEIEGTNAKSKIHIDQSGHIWVATNSDSKDKLLKINGSDITKFTAANSPLAGKTITAMHVDANNNLWLGTEKHGVLKYDDSTWTEYNTSNSALSGNRIVYIASNGNSVWVSTHFHGLNKIEGDAITVYRKTIGGLPSDYSKSLAFDHNGNLWLATCDDRNNATETPVFDKASGYGLTKFNGTTWTNYNTSNSFIPSNSVMDIGIDKYGNIWLATAGDAGLACFDGLNRWTLYNVRNSGISDNNVSKIAVDPNTDFIWMSHTSSGISLAKINASSPNTGLSAIAPGQPIPADHSIYDILGRKVHPSRILKGQIYIQNGQKFILTE